MNYRFVKISTFYRDFLTLFYERNAGIENKTYSEQYTKLMDQGFAWSDFFQKHLTNLGAEAHEIIHNAIPLQRAWARENNVPFNNTVLFQQLKKINPDIIMFQDTLSFPSSFYKELRDAIPGLKLLLGHICSPFTREHLKLLSNFDVVFTCSPGFQQIFTREGIKSDLLYHGFETSLLPKIKQENNYPSSDIVFIGSFIQKNDFHDERLRLMSALIEKGIDIKLYSKLNQDSFLNVLVKQILFQLVKAMKSMGLYDLSMRLPGIKKVATQTSLPQYKRYSSTFKKHVINTPLYGTEMLKALSKSKIGLNIHAGIAGEYAANVRLFEVTGVGSLLLTDEKKNLSNLFEPEKEIITFRTIEECIEKAIWLINHPLETATIAKAGQQRCLRDHTIEKRAIELNNKILSWLKK